MEIVSEPHSQPTTPWNRAQEFSLFWNVRESGRVLDRRGIQTVRSWCPEKRLLRCFEHRRLTAVHLPWVTKGNTASFHATFNCLGWSGTPPGTIHVLDPMPEWLSTCHRSKTLGIHWFLIRRCDWARQWRLHQESPITVTSGSVFGSFWIHRV